MVNAEIISVKKDQVRKTGERFLDVTVEITDGDEKETRKLGFPIDATDKDIEAGVKKLLETRASELAQKEVQQALDAEDETADKTIGKLEGKVIKG